jgi:ABC-2 type transport system permease protein
MVLRIARKELVDLLRDGRFRWSSAVVAALLASSVATGWRSWSEAKRERAAAQDEARAHFEGQDEKNPHAAAHYGLYVFKPKHPLAFVDPGIDPYSGVSVYLEAHRRNAVAYRPARDATALQRFGELNVSTVLQVLVPLLIIFLAFPAVAAEREQGTLRQLLSLGVDPRALLAGKALGLSAGLVLALLPGLVAGVVALAAGGGEAGWAAAGVLAVAYVAYLGIVLAASLYASARARSSGAALIALLGVWIANTMVAPRLATDLARRAVPTPSALEFAAAIERDIRGGIDGHDPQDARIERLKASLLEKYRVDTVEELPINFQGVALQASEDYGNAVFDRHYADLWRAYERQDAVRKALGVLFPTLAIRELSMALAGTDNAEYRDFAEEAESLRRAMVARLNRDLEVNGAELGFMYQAGAGLWRSMPRFRYRQADLRTTLFRQGFACVSVVFWLVATVELVDRSARRLRVD